MINDAIRGILDQKFIDYLSMIIPLLLQILGMVVTVLIDSYISKKHKKVILALALLSLGLITQNYVENRLAAGEPMPVLRTLVAIWGYSIRPVIIVCFLYIVSPNRRFRWVWALTGVNVAVHLTALFSHVVFYFTENHYQGGPLSKFCLYTSLVLLGYFVFLTIYEYGRARRWEIIIPIGNVLLIIGAVILDKKVGLHEQSVTFLTEAIVSSCFFFYIWLHLQFVRDHEKELKDGQRVQIMLSQIKPHFLYNSLGAIEELCDSDPQMAKAAIVTFSRYLRGNMNSLSAGGSISFEKELSHTKFYLELEQIRFEDALQVEYDISVTDFKMPTLTLEPLVENAVRHGVRKNKDGKGTITISTREYADRVEVSVRDDGPGFDPAAKPDDGQLHVGLQNVRERLMQVCDGTLRIESSIGKGSTVTIRLPKKQGEQKYD